MNKHAPKAKLRSSILEGRLPKKEMQRGEVDCAVTGYFADIPDGFYQRLLFEDGFIGLCRKEHPYLKQKGDLNAYCQYSHLMVSITGDFSGVIDRELPAQNKRHVCLTSASFLSLASTLKKTDSLFVLPRSLGKIQAKDFGLATFPAPVPTPKLKIKMVWHERVNRDPFQKWMREQIYQAVNNSARN